MPQDRTIADQIERDLACRILRGEVAPGARLPSVRDLAEQFEVTVPTIQRALDRLGRSGLVTARRGSGVTAEDPDRVMNLALIPLWFEAFADQPARCAKILADFLELRRAVVGHLFDQAGGSLVAALPELTRAAAQLAAAADLREVALADARMSRAVVRTVDNFALSAVFRTVEDLALEVPHVAEALYADRAAHLALIAQVPTAFANPDRARARADLLAAMEQWDRRAAAELERRLTAAKES